VLGTLCWTWYPGGMKRELPIHMQSARALREWQRTTPSGRSVLRQTNGSCVAIGQEVRPANAQVVMPEIVTKAVTRQSACARPAQSDLVHAPEPRYVQAACSRTRPACGTNARPVVQRQDTPEQHRSGTRIACLIALFSGGIDVASTAAAARRGSGPGRGG
jgi:hypothetical protein